MECDPPPCIPSPNRFNAGVRLMVLASLDTSSPTRRPTQVLGRVEAHINALRAQLNHKTTGVAALTDEAGFFTAGEGGGDVPPEGGPRTFDHPLATAATNASGGGAYMTAMDGVEDKIAGVAPLPIETRGNFHLSPPPAERSGNEDGLTEAEDMRLNRLLRASSPSASAPPPSGTLATPGAGKKGFLNAGGGNSDPKSRLRTMGEGDPGINSDISGDFFGVTCDPSRELFGASPFREAGSAGKVSFDVSGRTTSCRGEQEDDLEDISDGGFHSGCWKRKYVRGEIR